MATRSCASYSLLELCRAGAAGDRQAIDEIHRRRPFTHNGERVNLVEFVERKVSSRLARELAGGSELVLDYAKDLATDKFANLPQSSFRNKGPDCRKYYAAVVAKAATMLALMPSPTAIDEEEVTERILQAIVAKHVFLSIRDACRRIDRLITRFRWRGLVLWIPVEIPGRARRNWLDDVVGDADPTAPGERERIQAIVDLAVVRRRVVSLSEACEDQITARNPVAPTLDLAELVTVHGLAEAVVREKEANFSQLRPCLQVLDGRLARFIRRIFHDLEDGVYQPASVGREFGLSKPSMTRVAGIRWRNWGSAGMPDLFRNTAFVIAHHPHFVEAAKAAGVWDAVRKAVDGEQGASHEA